MRSVMLFQGDTPHPAHCVFGEAVDCEFVHFETGREPGETEAYTGRITDRVRTGLSITDADVVIAEGTAPLQTGVVASIRSGATLIYLCADQTFRTLHQRKTKTFWKLLPSVIDGVVAVSDLAWSWAAPYVDGPHVIVRPPIMDDKHERMCRTAPQSPDGPIVTMGQARLHKNFEILPEIADRTGREVIVVGEGHDDRSYTSHPSITIPGWVSLSELGAILERAGLYIQPSEADACPVASMEAMLSGTPVLVSDGTGTKELGSRHAPLDRFVDEAVAYIEKPREARERDGESNRDCVEEFTEKRQGRRFREAIDRWT
jgi:glycosyltransferase involved in cell wall biosynthesis